MLMRNARFIALTALFFTVCTLPASAQMGDNREMYEQMEKLERDVMTLQRQVARGGGAPISAADMPEGAGAAQLEVRLSSIEDEMRRLRGKVEEYEFQIKRNNDNAAKFQRDVEFRISDLEQRLANAARAGESAPAAAATDKTPDAAKPAPDPSAEERIDTSSEASVIVKDGDDKAASASGATTAGDGVLKQPKEENGDAAPTSFDTPRDHYNYAFRLLNQTKYEEAAKYFGTFTEKYKKDPLIGNAYYWLGETYYIRRDFVKAADNFREGFEALPGGPKAADNLLKLSMSLAAMKKTKDACVVLDQIVVRFKDSSQSTIKKAQSERTRIGCK